MWLTVGYRVQCAAEVLRCCPSAGGGDETSEIIIQTNFMLNLTVGRDGGRSETLQGGEQTTIVEVSCQQAAIAITTTTTGGGAGAATQRQHVHCAFRQLAGKGRRPGGEQAQGQEHTWPWAILKKTFVLALNYHT